jgi:hypothetical protein
MVNGRGADDEALVWYGNDPNHVIGFRRTTTVTEVSETNFAGAVAAASQRWENLQATEDMTTRTDGTDAAGLDDACGGGVLVRWRRTTGWPETARATYDVVVPVVAPAWSLHGTRRHCARKLGEAWRGAGGTEQRGVASGWRRGDWWRSSRGTRGVGRLPFIGKSRA